MHRAKDVDEHERARRHFAVREALALFGDVEAARRARERRSARAFPVDAEVCERILSRIPFVLTNDQRAAVDLLWQRLACPGAMGVLLQLTRAHWPQLAPSGCYLLISTVRALDGEKDPRNLLLYLQLLRAVPPA